ncbi:MAG TPA: 4a-hydroxytetrahydrobiopterin dehydratase [Candidatus Limnocylindrales bacterium]|nr:4a-hydroxytetrahydrobiopterin dehydratase [Candidatus Limnocylindrales bacterium]
MSDLASRKCVPCREGTPPLSEQEAQRLLGQLDGWAIENNHHLSKKLKFPDFAAALAYVNVLGRIAEEEAHHPDIHLGWGRVGVEIWTHAAGGLTENDFILAAKADRAYAAVRR